MTHTTLTPHHYRSKPHEFLSFLPSEMKRPKLKRLPPHTNFPSLPGPMRPSITSPTLLPGDSIPRPSSPQETHRHLQPLHDTTNVFKPLAFTSAESAALERDIPQRIKVCCVPAFSLKSHSSPNRLERDIKLQTLHAFRPPPVSTHSHTPQFARFEDVFDKDKHPQLDAISFPLPPNTPATSHPCTLHQISLLASNTNTVRGYLLNGPVTLPLLEQALDATACTHPLLYSSFSLGDAPTFRISRHSLRAKLRVEQKSISARKPDELVEIGLSTNFSPFLMSQLDTSVPPLVKAWVYSFGAHEHVLILSFPAVVCDFYSATLFTSQLCSRYSQLIRESKSSAKLVPTKPPNTKSAKSTQREMETKRTMDAPSFTQVAHRESTLLRFTPLPDSVHAWYRHLLMFPSSDRLVPQARIPHSFSKEGKSALTKPRLRSALQKSASAHRSSDFLAFSIDREMTSSFLELMLLREGDGIPERDRLCVLSLTAYSLLLAVYFRGLSEHTLTAGVVMRESSSVSRKYPKSLQQSSLLFNHEKMQLKSAKKRESRARSETCIFTIGVSNSYRHLSPSLCSLLAPLTYLSYFRVDLYECHTFSDFTLSVAKSLAFSLTYSHVPLTRVKESLDLKQPELRFSFLHQSEMRHVSSTDAHFQEHGTAKLGPNCYLSPLSSKGEEGCGLEMVVWEGPNERELCGGFRFNPARISKSVVQELRNKFGETIEYVVADLDITLLELVRLLT